MDHSGLQWFRYASPISASKDKLWTRLHEFSAGLQEPWALVGDFNGLSSEKYSFETERKQLNISFAIQNINK